MADLTAWRDTPLCPAGHLPHKGGDWQDAPSRPLIQHDRIIATLIKDCGHRHESISPLVGEMPGRAEGGIAADSNFAEGVGILTGANP
jgi:hypothetical protein